VIVPRKVPKIPSCRDPWDLPFLQLAAHARADFLVTGDRDLLDIRDKMRFAIVAAETFMSKLENLERSEL
jgi:predicted nucleic acid-binding protein